MVIIHAKVKDGIVDTFPYDFAVLQAENPNTNFGGNYDCAELFPGTEAATKGFSLVEVTMQNPPSFDPSRQRLDLGVPQLVDGAWRCPWVPTTFSEKEREQLWAMNWSGVRSQRNRLLAESDWTQLPDAPVDAEAWAEYRQALRDITNQPDPFAIVWPQTPA